MAAFFITGATGQQGGAIVRGLIASPKFDPTKHTIYALTRNPASGGSKRLSSLSTAIKLVEGQFDQPGAIWAQLDQKPDSVYIVHGLGGDEVKDSIGLMDEAIRGGAKHIVWSSVDRGGQRSETDPTDVPHFMTKHTVDQYLKEKVRESNETLIYTILRPVFFMDNFKPGFLGKVIATSWKDSLLEGQKLQLIDTKDIGVFGAEALLDPHNPAYYNRGISLAGDELTYHEANTIWKRGTGEDIPYTFSFIAWIISVLSKEVGYMFRWFRKVGYGADIKVLRAHKTLTTFEEWVEREIVPKNR